MSNDPVPIRPRFQLSSIKRTTELWSVTVLVHEISFRVRRDHEKGQAWSISAARLEAGKSVGSRAARACSRQCVLGRTPTGLDRPNYVIVPTIRVVVRDDHRRALPFLQRLKLVQRVRNEGLLVERRRIARVTVLRRVRLQVADCWKVSGESCLPEIGEVVLMVCGTVVANFLDARRENMMAI